MTLTTHAIVGAAAASLFPAYPVIGFAAAFASHFALDAIPHWAEGPALLRSVVKDPTNKLKTDMRINKDFLRDLAVLAVDALLGLVIAILILYALFQVPLYIVVLGVIGGQLPDALQFVYYKTRLAIMTPLQKFHGRIQTEHENIAYLGIEVGLILAVVAFGILGVFNL
jgi:hypothetical protein